MEETKFTMPIIGQKAPEFVASTTQGVIHFPEDFKGKWVVLFSHPSDFTPVCSTEFMTFAAMQKDFEKLNTQLIGLSVDSLASHIAWLRKLGEFEWNGINRPEIKFPVIEDLKMEVAKKYGMIQAQSDNSAVRAVFVIDPKAVIRLILYYPASTGRNMEEIKRVVKALQLADQEGIATPANWKPGEDVILPTPGSCVIAKERLEGQGSDQYCLDWFLCFKKLKK